MRSPRSLVWIGVVGTAFLGALASLDGAPVASSHFGAAARIGSMTSSMASDAGSGQTLAATADPEGWVRLPAGAPDYAPSGLPDFDQRQARWRVEVMGEDRWTHDGPVALADALWWLDSREEPGSTPPPVPSDGFALVTSYGSWDDHATDNVRPLVTDLAGLANTNEGSAVLATGTCMGDLASGARAFLSMAPDGANLDVRVTDTPTIDALASSIARGRPSVLLLGFWQHHPAAGWQRIGGHYAALEAVDRTSGRIRISDPYRDTPITAFSALDHNDAAAVAHDEWRVSPSLRPGTPLWLEGYLDESQEVEGLLYNFYGLNGHDCPSGDAPWLEGAVLEAQIEAALVIEPAATPSATPPVTPQATASGTSPSPQTPVAPTLTATTTGGPPPGSGTPDPTPSSTPQPSLAPTDPIPTSTATVPSPTPTIAATSSATQQATEAALPSATAPTMATPLPSETPAATSTATEPATPTPDVGHLCGYVLDESRQTPVGGAEVWLLLEAAPVAFAETPADGSFCFRELPPGQYEVRVRAAGCTPAGRLVQVTYGMVNADVALTCRPVVAFLPIAISPFVAAR